MKIEYAIRLDTGEACIITESRHIIEADVSKGGEIYDIRVSHIKLHDEPYFQILMRKIEKETGIKFYKKIENEIHA